MREVSAYAVYIHGVCMAYMLRTLMTSGMWSDGWTALHGAAQNAGSVGVGSPAVGQLGGSTSQQVCGGCRAVGWRIRLPSWLTRVWVW